jgi:recA bacterial DNA recombination protein
LIASSKAPYTSLEGEEKANMPSATLQRLEQLLHEKHLGGTLPARGLDRDPSAVAATGMASLDDRIQGGWPRGEISEIIGAPSSGRTSVVAATLARATRHGEYAALIDAVDRFDLDSAIACGLDPARLLWVRGPVLTVELARSITLDRVVQQSLRAFDLVLRTAGFSVVILDMADLPAAAIRTLPAATWFRLAHVNEGRQTAGVLVGQAPVGRSARGVRLPLAGRPVWTGASPQSRRFEGIRVLALAGLAPSAPLRAGRQG